VTAVADVLLLLLLYATSGVTGELPAHIGSPPADQIEERRVTGWD